jgi:iron complex outermembrane recepter protein
MSELIDTGANRAIIRRQLLATASALALTMYLASTDVAGAEDADRPTVWIELGGQLDSLNSPQQVFSPPFMASITQANLLSALNVQRPPTSALGIEGKILLQPNGSDWVFSASIRYGRSAAARDRHQQTANKTITVNPFTYHGINLPGHYYYPTLHAKFADGKASQSETHAVIDFQAGKDVGLGMFGSGGSSVLSAGVRIAQFTSKSNVGLHAEPDVRYPTTPIDSKYELQQFQRYHVHFHDYGATASAQRSFRGLGPSLAWNASVPVAGDSGSGEISIDWGLNGAVLFGRQRASGDHKTAVRSYYDTVWNPGFQKGPKLQPGYFRNNHSSHTCYGAVPNKSAGLWATACHTNAANFNRMRTVVVPNLVGVAGLSFRIEDFKVAVGYRADFFFGAMDGGIDTARKENQGFYGPFASVSVGLGG